MKKLYVAIILGLAAVLVATFFQSIQNSGFCINNSYGAGIISFCDVIFYGLLVSFPVTFFGCLFVILFNKQRTSLVDSWAEFTWVYLALYLLIYVIIPTEDSGDMSIFVKGIVAIIAVGVYMVVSGVFIVRAFRLKEVK